MLDRDQLARVAKSGPEPIFATVSGAHLYGFASPDSDVDLRGAFLLPLRSVLGLRPAGETLSVQDRGSIELDWVAHDLRKFAKMMINHNGYVLEQLFSPLVALTSSAHAELLELGRGCVTRPLVGHYRGFARGRRKRLAEPEPTLKHLLYAYRVLLTGIFAMRTGEVISNLPALNRHFAIAAIDELIARKREAPEHGLLATAELGLHDRELDRLELALSDAHAKSGLPEQPTCVQALDAFVIRVRLEAIES